MSDKAPNPRRTIRQRIARYGILLGALVLAAGGIALWQINRLTDAVGALQVAQERATAAREVRQASTDLIAAVSRLLQVEDAAAIETEVASALDVLRQRHAGWTAFTWEETGDGAADALPGQVSERISNVISIAETMVRQARDGQWPSARVRMALLVRDHQQLADETNALVELAQQMDQAAAQQVSQARQAALLYPALVLGLCAALGLAMIRRTMNDIARPVEQLTQKAARLASGFLAERVSVESADELGQLAVAFNQMADSLSASHAELERRIATRTAQLRASADVGRAAVSILSPDRLLREVVNLITERFGFYYAAIFTLDEAGGFAVLREAAGPGDVGRVLKERGHKLEVNGQSMVGFATGQRRPRIALDVGVEAVRFANPLLPETRSEIALPLVVGDRVLGALDVQSTQAAAFDESSLAVLQGMADQVAVALANAQSFDAVQAALHTTTRLYELGRALFTATSPHEACAAVVQESVRLAGLDRLSVILIAARDADREPIEYEVAAEWDAARGRQIESGARCAPAQLPLASLVNHESIVVVRDASDPALPYAARRSLEQAGGRAALIAPLIVRGQFDGFVAAAARQPTDFADGDVRYLQLMTEQLALVIGSLRSNAETHAALDRVALLNQRLSGEAWQRYLTSRPGLTVQSGRLDPERVANRLSTPIVVRGETLGTLDVEDADADRQWTDDEWELVSAIAGEAAQAIDNARLIEQAQQRVARETRVNQIAEKIRRAANFEAILRVAAEELSQALDTSHANARLSAPARVTGQHSGERD
jgi:GAF domain-containing protein/HAMP domain-containing protein